MVLTKSQEKAVNKLFDLYKNRNNLSEKTYFKAPTGSGKTFMSSELISKIFEYNNSIGVKSIVIVATVSSASLPYQFAKKLESYKKYHQFNNYSIEHIYSPSNSKNNKLEYVKEFNLENNKVFVFGISSFGKNKLFTLHNTLDNFINEAKRENYQIIFIRDEAHIGSGEKTNKNDLKNFDLKMENCSDFIIKMTATPKEQINLIELTTEDLQNDDKFLLKSESKEIRFDDEKNEEDIIDNAIKQFIETKREYEKLENVVINPAMLIQVDNDSNMDKEKHLRFDEGMRILEKKLKDYGLKYLKYIDNPIVVGTSCPNTLEYASKNDSIIDVIIFKVGPATGWDIPRANMLLQLRSIFSESLNMQTVGRIMRNPYPNLEKNNITNKYYLYSNYQKPSRSDANYRLENKFDNLNLYVGKINEQYKKVIENNNEYIKKAKEYINSKEFKNFIIDFLDEDIIYDKQNISGKEIIYPIINYLYLKIYNIKKINEFENSLKISIILDDLKNLSIKLNKNLEKIKYIFFSNINKIKTIYNECCSWYDDKDAYGFSNSSLLKNYNIWKDNENIKKINFKDIENYGYKQINSKIEEHSIQYLDSTPEEKFFSDAIRYIIENKKFIDKDVKFFAKMPTLGSPIYFEYFSKETNSIAKSYMDFAIIIDNKLLMIEVKSYDSDYNYGKTQDLENAYAQYMKKQNELISKNKWINLNNITKLILVVYKYDKTNNTREVSYYNEDSNEWVSNASFNEMLKSL